MVFDGNCDLVYVNWWLVNGEFLVLGTKVGSSLRIRIFGFLEMVGFVFYCIFFGNN